MTDIKLRLDDAMILAIDEARGNKAEWLLPSGRSIPPSRVEMIRRLITRGLDADKTTAAKIAASKQRTAESRERTRKLRGGFGDAIETVERKLPVLERELGRVFSPKK